MKHNNNELGQALEIIFSKEVNDVHYIGKPDNAYKFKDLLENNALILSDHPDGVIISGKTAYAIEHFEFDAYKRKKGSIARSEAERINRVHTFNPACTGIVYQDAIVGESSYELYVKNVIESFDKHYLHIDSYIENVKTKYNVEECKMMFMIIDTTPLGTTVLSENEKMELVSLGTCKEFLEHMALNSHVDYVLSGAVNCEGSFIWFIDNSQIEEYLSNSRNYSELQFLDWTPQVVGFNIPLPNTTSGIHQG